jgi:hypothetical protein
MSTSPEVFGSGTNSVKVSLSLGPQTAARQTPLLISGDPGPRDEEPCDGVDLRPGD